jgi:hypothetical protein
MHQLARLNIALREFELEPPTGGRVWSEELPHHAACGEPAPEDAADIYSELLARSRARRACQL